MTSRGLSLAWVRPARAGPSISPRELPRDHRGFATSDHASCLSFLSFLYAPRVRPAHTAQAQLVQDRKRLPRNRHSQSTRLPFLSEHLERACARSYPPPPDQHGEFCRQAGDCWTEFEKLARLLCVRLGRQVLFRYSAAMGAACPTNVQVRFKGRQQSIDDRLGMVKVEKAFKLTTFLLLPPQNTTANTACYTYKQ